MTTFDYARISTQDQNLDSDNDALTAAGAQRIFTDRVTGRLRNLPELDRMIHQLRAGDAVVMPHIVEATGAKGAGFRSLAEEINTTTPAGRLAFRIFGSIAEFELERISERTREGLMAA